ncbi:hypothetical protein GQ53DRAFT_834466 [Thozetella sp. PMI_491]|nr:hypothetical protein GQ53DRAFT_834466 [Thozetella sp. PMI_491]
MSRSFGLRALIASLFLGSVALAFKWPRCQEVDYLRYLSAKDDPVTGRNGIGPHGFYIFHKDWKKDGDPCLFLNIMAPGFAKEHPVEHNFFLYIVQYDVDNGINRDGWLGDADHMYNTKAVLERIGRIPEPEGFHVIEEMGPKNDPEREAERLAAGQAASETSTGTGTPHAELKKRAEATE